MQHTELECFQLEVKIHCISAYVDESRMDYGLVSPRLLCIPNI